MEEEVVIIVVVVIVIVSFEPRPVQARDCGRQVIISREITASPTATQLCRRSLGDLAFLTQPRRCYLADAVSLRPPHQRGLADAASPN